MELYLEQGTVIEKRYKIRRKIGSGGMGSVYEASDLRLHGSARAIKIFHSKPSDTLNLTIEAKLLLQLEHPSLPTIYDYYASTGANPEMMVMSFVEGKSLAQMLRENHIFPLDQLLHISMQLVSALIYLHEQPIPIIHRDLKPSNVLLNHQGKVTLIDFGISRYFKFGLHEDTVKLGTYGFAAPEQFGGDLQSDVKTDIYGLGALLYCLWEGTAYNQQQNGLQRNQLLLRRKGAPRGFVEMLSMMLEHNPANRYFSMREVEAKLLQLRQLSHLHEQAPIWPAFSSHGLTIGVFSLYNGAGSTLLTLALAELLGRSGASVAAAEFHDGSPEWEKLLPAVKLLSQKDKHSRFYHMRSTALSIDYYVKAERMDVYDQSLQQMSEELHEQLHVRLNAQQHNHMMIMDFSARQMDEVWQYWVDHANYIIVVADPFMAKWSQSKVEAFDKASEKRGKDSFFWIANKMERFRHEEEWLSYFPIKPAAAVPLLPARELLQTMWSFSMLTDNGILRKMLHVSFRPILSKLLKEMDTKNIRI